MKNLLVFHRSYRSIVDLVTETDMFRLFRYTTGMIKVN